MPDTYTDELDRAQESSSEAPKARTTEERLMARTDVADVRDTAKQTASTALDNAKAQAASAGTGLAAAAKPALDRAAAQGRIAREQARARAKELAEEAAAQGRKARKQARKRAKELADEAAKSARKRA